jgi:hypothetical protein
LFILVYGKTYPLQVVQGRLFGMGQSKAHQWLHLLLVVLLAALRAWGGCPRPPFGRVGAAPRGGRGGSGRHGRAAGGAGVSRQRARGGPAPGDPLPPVGHDGTERRLERP